MQVTSQPASQPNSIPACLLACLCDQPDSQSALQPFSLLVGLSVRLPSSWPHRRPAPLPPQANSCLMPVVFVYFLLLSSTHRPVSPHLNVYSSSSAAPAFVTIISRLESPLSAPLNFLVCFMFVHDAVPPVFAAVCFCMPASQPVISISIVSSFSQQRILLFITLRKHVTDIYTIRT